jgi:hypothetical protein
VNIISCALAPPEIHFKLSIWIEIHFEVINRLRKFIVLVHLLWCHWPSTLSVTLSCVHVILRFIRITFSMPLDGIHFVLVFYDASNWVVMCEHLGRFERL